MDTYIVIVDRPWLELLSTSIEAVERDYQWALRAAKGKWETVPRPESVRLEHWFSGTRCCIDYVRSDGRVDNFIPA